MAKYGWPQPANTNKDIRLTRLVLYDDQGQVVLDSSFPVVILKPGDSANFTYHVKYTVYGLSTTHNLTP